MVIPIIILVSIPIFLGIVYVAPFDQPEEFEQTEISEEFESEVISEEPDVSFLYFVLMGIWTLYLLKILLQIKKGTFKSTQRYLYEYSTILEKECLFRL